MRAIHIGVTACTFPSNAPIDAARILYGRPPTILFWLLAIVVAAVASAALYYAAAGRTVNATAEGIDAATAAHYRLQLKELDADIASGRLGTAEGQAARGEMARELIRLKSEGKPGTSHSAGHTPMLIGAIAATLIVAFGTYWYLGSPDMPAAPIASRPEASMSVEDAVVRIEQALTQTPDDIRGWRVIAPAYMELGRFADAERAFRRVLELGGATADAETNLAEAIMMKQSGSIEGEPLTLLASAAGRDPAHVRSRFYLAAEATQSGKFETAVTQWNELLALSSGDEPWVQTARDGLAAATAGLNNENVPGEAEILAMVEGLASRLASDGGTVEEWTRLVRSRLVLGQTAEAQAAYDAARTAYPDAAVRTELDVLAADNGLVAN
jgi:cytochrome c-type biogenesis protein CcmH